MIVTLVQPADPDIADPLIADPLFADLQPADLQPMSNKQTIAPSREFLDHYS